MLNHADFVAVLEAESARCLAALRSTDLDAKVPSCPAWTAADLAWHLADVQRFWTAIVAEGVDDPHRVQEQIRPADEELPALLADKSAGLVDALSSRPPDEHCWSWHEAGHDVGWVARRQAHEALIHRVDAELTAGADVTEPDPGLAADGVDEILAFMIDNVPPWGRFEADGAALRLETTDAPADWTVEFGRFTGTSPRSGRTYDLDAARLRAEPATADATISARAWDLDLWLWGRGDEDALAVTGDRALASRLRAIAADSTV